MRGRLALIPLVAAAALVAGCTTGTPTPTPSASTGNGIAGLSAEEIISKAQAAYTAAKSVHLKGDVNVPGVSLASASPAGVAAKATVDAQVKGKDFTGTVTTNGFAVQAIRSGTDLYIKAPDQMWTTLVPAGLQSLVSQIKGKWVKIDSKNSLGASFSNFSDPDQLINNDNGFTKGEKGSVDGKPAIALVDKKDGTRLWISTEGEPVPLRRDLPNGLGSLAFTEYGSAVTITAPAAAEVFDMKALMGG